MYRLLIILGLVTIPFYEIILKALPFVRNMSPDSRAPKEILAMIFALSIGLLAVYEGKIKTFKNKWFLIIPSYLLLNLIISPHVDLFINNVESGDLYFWKPFSEVLCFTFMIISIASCEINYKEIMKIMVICGAIMSVYVILQKLGLDQFWVARQGQEFIEVRGRFLGGNLGQPTIVSSWIIMMVPIAFYLKRYWMAMLMIISCLLTQGAMVTMALGVIGILSLIRFNKLFILLALLIIAISAFMIINNKNRVIERMDGRYSVWENTLKDIYNGQIDNSHKYSITGIGFGRFPFLFPDKNKSDFMQTHNDPLEFVYNCGIFGGFLLLAGIFFMFINNFFNSNSLIFSLSLSFIGIFFCSLGSFPFQLGSHQFYSAILVGFLHNESIIKGEVKC